MSKAKLGEGGMAGAIDTTSKVVGDTSVATLPAQSRVCAGVVMGDYES